MYAVYTRVAASCPDRNQQVDNVADAGNKHPPSPPPERPSSRQSATATASHASALARRDKGGFDLLWEGAAAPSRGPKPSLHIDEIVKAAIHIVGAAGLRALNIRSVAEHLRVAPMALYRYFPSKDVLIDVMADFAMRGAPEPLGENWRDDIVAWARANLAMLYRHPWLIEVINTQIAIGPNWAKWLDTGLASLQSLPLSLSEKMAVILAVDGHVRAGAQLQIGAKSSDAWTGSFGRMLERVSGDKRFATLDGLVSSGRFAESGLGLDELLEFGLERLLDGITAYAAARSEAWTQRAD